MRQQRTHLEINAGNLLETAAAILAAYGVYRLAGMGWALIVGFVLLVALAEWVFPTSVWRVPLPSRPQPRERLRARSHALAIRWYRAKDGWRRRRQA